MGRLPALFLCAFALSAFSVFAGCRKDGSIQVSWVFDDGAGGKQSAADGCGQHGVDSVLISSFDTGSDSDQVQALCAPGVVTRRVPAGTWTVTVQALDSQGALIQAGVSPQIDAGVSPQADAGVSPQADAGVSAQADAGVSPQADAGVSAQADAGVSAQADAGVSPQADAGVSSSGFRLSQTQVDLVVTDDGPTVPFAVTFRPLPACMDGVDNDGDGRVDLDDPDCADDPYGKHE